MEKKDLEKLALDKVIRAGVKVSSSALGRIVIMRWIRSVGPESILKSSLKEILVVANAF